MKAATVNRCQGTPCSEKLDGEKLHGAAGCDMEPRESTVSSKSSVRTIHQLHKHLQECGIILFSRGAVS